MEVSVTLLIFIWAIGVVASLGASFILRNEFFDSKEAIVYIAKMSIASLFLSWVLFFIQMVIIISVWLMYHDD